jgi:hypothetical protein
VEDSLILKFYLYEEIAELTSVLLPPSAATQELLQHSWLLMERPRGTWGEGSGGLPVILS